MPELSSAENKGGFGYHPLIAFLDHGPDGPSRIGSGGERWRCCCAPARTNANIAADHISVLGRALAQLPAQVRRWVLVRTDSGGGTKALLTHLSGLGLPYSTGMRTNIGVGAQLFDTLPEQAWIAAYDPDGLPRDGAQVTELTGLVVSAYYLTCWFAYDITSRSGRHWDVMG